jgi:hypothetical protein
MNHCFGGDFFERGNMDDLVSREVLLNAIYDFIEDHRYDGRVSWDGDNWLLISDDVKEIIRKTNTTIKKEN